MVVLVALVFLVSITVIGLLGIRGWSTTIDILEFAFASFALGATAGWSSTHHATATISTGVQTSIGLTILYGGLRRASGGSSGQERRALPLSDRELFVAMGSICLMCISTLAFFLGNEFSWSTAVRLVILISLVLSYLVALWLLVVGRLRRRRANRERSGELPPA